ncbi:hypothetical protein ACFOYU_21785 [Microvirga sp. GCM10011540]|uniref:hypothetical protein n=1 Tax=Microvirga sp. GCM10011540 TaxID=3317338 RepID=UPI0036113487
MSINWLILTPGPESLLLPTYGYYGGPGYSGGALIGAGEVPDPTLQPQDPLDALFRQHDAAYTPTATQGELAQADILLIENILALPEEAVTGEGDLYAGAAVLAMIYQIVERHDQPQVLAQIDLRDTIRGAVDLIEQGSVEPDPQEIAGFVTWLTTTGNALAQSDSPLGDALSEEFLDLAASLAAAPPAEFQNVLTDEALDFLEDLGSHLEDAVETMATTAKLDDLRDLLDGDAFDWAAVLVPDSPPPSLAALADRLDLPWKGDFLI